MFIEITLTQSLPANTQSTAQRFLRAVGVSVIFPAVYNLKILKCDKPLMQRWSLQQWLAKWEILNVC